MTYDIIQKSSKDLAESGVRNLGPMVIADPKVVKNLISLVSTFAFIKALANNKTHFE